MSAIVVGLCGPTSSGKSTIARALKEAFPGCLLVHQDDFYLPLEAVPTQDGTANWDCPEALNIPALHDAIDKVAANFCIISL
jgi:nicotinamide/nicotinate riboside kinase